MVDLLLVGLIAAVVFLLLERFHYRRRISDLYDLVIDGASGLEPRFELRTHSALRRLYSLDAILDDLTSKIELVLRHLPRSPTDSADVS